MSSNHPTCQQHTYSVPCPENTLMTSIVLYVVYPIILSRTNIHTKLDSIADDCLKRRLMWRSQIKKKLIVQSRLRSVVRVDNRIE